jgi:hypothetical protein
MLALWLKLLRDYHDQVENAKQKPRNRRTILEAKTNRLNSRLPKIKQRMLGVWHLMEMPKQQHQKQASHNRHDKEHRENDVYSGE